MKVELTKPQVEAISTVLLMILNDPDWQESSGMTSAEWRSFTTGSERIISAGGR